MNSEQNQIIVSTDADMRSQLEENFVKLHGTEVFDFVRKVVAIEVPTAGVEQRIQLSFFENDDESSDNL